MQKHAVRKQFFRYVSQNILGMIGVSAYILADTFFISLAEKTDGITALNLVLPLYSLIFAIGSMLGTGAATRFALERHEGKRADRYLAEALEWALILSVPFVLVGAFGAGDLVRLFGGEPHIVEVGKPYTQIFMLFTPIFMANYILRAFVLNDGDPSLSMTATLMSSLFNIVMDWVLMFPLGMGMAGAALATAISPLVGIAINSLHFLKKRNTLRFCWHRPTCRMLTHISAVGVSGFISEIAGGVTTMVLNFLILGLTGSIGVAAYGVVANVAMVATAIFSGIAQGSQPLLSDAYSRGQHKTVRMVLRMSIGTALAMAILTLLSAIFGAEAVTAVFNSENDPVMASLATEGMQLYFIGYLFAGFNIAGTGYLSAVGAAKWAMITSILRGVVAIIACAMVMAALFGMTGVWLAFCAAEAVTSCVMMVAMHRVKKEHDKREM